MANTRRLARTFVFLLAAVPLPRAVAQEQRLDALRPQIAVAARDPATSDPSVLFVLVNGIRAVPDHPGGEEWGQRKLAKATAMAELLSVLHSAIDWNFDLKNFPENPADDPYPQDTAGRATWAARLKAASEYALVYNKQRDLRRLYDQMAHDLGRYAEFYFKGNEKTRLASTLQKAELVRKNGDLVREWFEQR